MTFIIFEEARTNMNQLRSRDSRGFRYLRPQWLEERTSFKAFYHIKSHLTTHIPIQSDWYICKVRSQLLSLSIFDSLPLSPKHTRVTQIISGSRMKATQIGNKLSERIPFPL